MHSAGRAHVGDVHSSCVSVRTSASMTVACTAAVRVCAQLRASMCPPFSSAPAHPFLPTCGPHYTCCVLLHLWASLHLLRLAPSRPGPHKRHAPARAPGPDGTAAVRQQRCAPRTGREPGQLARCGAGEAKCRQHQQHRPCPQMRGSVAAAAAAAAGIATAAAARVEVGGVSAAGAVMECDGQGSGCASVHAAGQLPAAG